MVLKFLTFLVVILFLQTSLSASEIYSRFLFRVDKESIEEIADRFSSSPSTIRGIMAIMKNGNSFVESENNSSEELRSGDILSLPDLPPLKIVDLGKSVSPYEASEKLLVPIEDLLRLNTFTLAKNGNNQSRYVVIEAESLWSINRKKYEWGLQFLGGFFVPIYFVSLFLLGFGIVFSIRKILGSSKNITHEHIKEKKEISSIIIEVLNGKFKGKRIKIEKTDFTIGRESDYNHELTLEGESIVSGKHARIHLKSDGWVINDLGSKGGTLLNKRDISRDTKITHGMIIELGFGGVLIKLEPFTPEIAKAYGVKSTTEIKQIAREANTGEFSKKTKVFSFVILFICLILAGFGYKTLVLENRISLVEENIIRHEKSMAGLKSEIDEMNFRVNSLENSRKETESQLRTLLTKIQEVSRKTDQNSKEIKSLQDKVEKLPSKLSSFQKRSVEFSKSVSDLNSFVIQKKPEDEIQKKSDDVKEKFDSLKEVAAELQIDIDDLEKSTTRIEVEPEKEIESGVKIVDLLRSVKKSMRGVNPILKATFDILHSLVDNKIVLTLAPIVKEVGVLGVFGFLI
ncbi:MAG: FHA domain-containing protein [Spirochaetia bacterium]|nr:FHA domain-containing protein [Spirochaetia bacterium]